MLERSQSLLQYYNNIGVLRTMDPTLHFKMKARQPMLDLVTGLQTRREPMMDLAPRLQIRRHQKQKQKQTVVSVDREHRDGCAS